MTAADMTRGITMKHAHAFAAAAALAFIGSGAHAQTVSEALGQCSGGSQLSCISQIGDGNATTINHAAATRSKAFVHVSGSNNGRGAIVGQSRTLANYNAGGDRDADLQMDQNDSNDGWDHSGGRSAWETRRIWGVNVPVYRPDWDSDTQSPGSTTLSTLALESGVVRQQGHRNTAQVVIRGDSNDYHVTQKGDLNSATEVQVGDGNAAAIYQGGRDGLAANGNFALEVQFGSGNLAYAEQNGTGNVAVLGQVGFGGALSAAELSGMSLTELSSGAAARAMGGANGNEILLRQQGDGAQAYLMQVGNGHKIALQQETGATATITQLGANRQVALNQTGTTPITITQFGR